MKYYAVKVGARTGVFTSWEECQKAVDGFSGAKFKKFHSLEEAERFVYDDSDSKPIKENLIDGYINAYVDGSYDSSTGRYSGAARNYVFDSREVIDIKFVKVKGHSGNEYNNRADYLAGKALSV